MRGNKKDKRTVRLRYAKYHKRKNSCGCYFCCGDYSKYLKLKYSECLTKEV